MCISFHNTTYTSRNLDFFHCYYTFLHNNFNIYFLSFFPFSTFHLGDVVNAYLGGGSLVAKSCLILCDPMDCSPPVSSVHGVSQARILEQVTDSFCKGSSQSRNQTCTSCLAGGFFTTEPPGKPPEHIYIYIYILFHILFNSDLSQDVKYSSPCSAAGPCCLFILYMLVCIC